MLLNQADGKHHTSSLCVNRWDSSNTVEIDAAGTSSQDVAMVRLPPFYVFIIPLLHLTWSHRLSCRYQTKLAQRPLLTQSLTTAVSNPLPFLACIDGLTIIIRSFSRPATLWRSKPLRESDQRSTTSRAPGEWLSTAAVLNSTSLTWRAFN